MGRLFYLPKESNLRVFCMYTRNKGVVAATPPGTRHMAHATYLNEGATNSNNRSNIDYFLITEDIREEDIFGKDVRVLHGKGTQPLITNQRPSVEDKYGARLSIVNEFRDLRPVLERIMMEDIHSHMIDRKDPKVNDQSWTEFVEDIPSSARLHVAGQAQIDIEGKQTFYPNCALDLNLDVAKWCPSGIAPDGRVMPWGACYYCYSSFKHTGYPNVFGVDKKALHDQITIVKALRANKGLQTRYLRLGKKTEMGFHEFRDQLAAILEVCFMDNIDLVFPTKYLGFDKEIARLLESTNSTLLPSLGDDRFEKGAVMHGCTNDWRFEQGVLYQEAGVRVVPYILISATEEDGGATPGFTEEFGKNFRKAKKRFGKVQVLPLVTKKKKVAERILGASDKFLGPYHEEDLMGEPCGGYEMGKGRRGVPIYLHPSLENKIGDNNGDIRICWHNSCTSQCGKCFLPRETGEIVPTEEVNLEKRSRWFRKRERYNGRELLDMHSPEIKKGRQELEGN